MKKMNKLIEVRTPKGEPLFQLSIMETVLSETEEPIRSQPSANPSASKPSINSGGNGMKPQNGNGKQTTDEMMTEPQKKCLFRIMAEQGRVGDVAHDELKRLLKVKTLKEVTKTEASRMIDDLLKKQNAGESANVSGDGGGNGSSF